MKEFNLEKALTGEPVVTRYGHNILQIHYEERCKDDYHICAYVEDVGWECYKSDGSCLDEGEYYLDLFMAPVKKEGWINLYKNAGGKVFSGSGVYKTKEETEKIGKNWDDNYMATVKIEWEE